jgi:hypothetical protein
MITKQMGAAVTKFHTDEKGLYVLDEVCPGMIARGGDPGCSAPTASKDDHVKELGAKKFYLVSDPVANPQVGAFVPYPVGQQGFFMDSQDARGKDVAADPPGFQKSIYAMTNIRDPTQMGQDAVSALNVPTAWCAHIKPCPAGVRCCPDVAPALPVLNIPKQEAIEAAVAASRDEGFLKSKAAKAIFLVLFLVALYLAYNRFIKSRRGAAEATYSDF